MLLTHAGVPWRLIKSHNCELQVPLVRSQDAANRYPDLIVLAEEHLSLTRKRLTITLDMPPPQLVVEVVSPGKVNQENDYTHKRAQYAARGIPEYWIIDPGSTERSPNVQQQLVVVLRLEDGRYVKSEFLHSDRIISPTFPVLNSSAQQIFEAVKP